jgi:hypothetical protein
MCTLLYTCNSAHTSLLPANCSRLPARALNPNSSSYHRHSPKQPPPATPQAAHTRTSLELLNTDLDSVTIAPALHVCMSLFKYRIHACNEIFFQTITSVSSSSCCPFKP